MMSFRTEFTGVYVTPSVKKAIMQEAIKSEQSISKWLSHAIYELMKTKGYTVSEIE